MPEDQHEAAQAKGRQRYGGYLEMLGRRLFLGKTLAKEVSREIESAGGRAAGVDTD